MITRTIIGNEIANRLRDTQDRGQQAVGIVFEQIIEALARREKIQVHGFGTFGVKRLPAREGRNPFSGEKIAIAASFGVTFRPAQALKAALNPAPVRKVGGERNSPAPQRKRA